MPEILNIDAVQAWLESQPEGSLVGTLRDSCDCPLARFLRSLGHPDAFVGVSVFSLKESADFNSAIVAGMAGYLPSWAFNFVLRADDTYWSGTITREDALGLLETMRQYG